MGSNPRGFITVQAASKILSCSDERVKRLAKNGLLKHRVVKKEMLVDAEDVSAIKRIGITEELPGKEIIQELKLLKATVSRLESSVDMLFQVNDMLSTRLGNVETPQLVQIHEALSKDLEEEDWPIDRILSYCEIFVRLSEEDIVRMDEALGIEHSWEPFYKLLMKVTRYVTSHNQFTTSLELQQVNHLLSVGRANLRSIALFFTHEYGKNRPSKELLADMATNDIDMFDDLAKQLKAKGRRGHLASVRS